MHCVIDADDLKCSPSSQPCGKGWKEKAELIAGHSLGGVMASPALVLQHVASQLISSEGTSERSRLRLTCAELFGPDVATALKLDTDKDAWKAEGTVSSFKFQARSGREHVTPRARSSPLIDAPRRVLRTALH